MGQFDLFRFDFCALVTILACTYGKVDITYLALTAISVSTTVFPPVLQQCELLLSAVL